MFLLDPKFVYINRIQRPYYQEGLHFCFQVRLFKCQCCDINGPVFKCYTRPTYMIVIAAEKYFYINYTLHSTQYDFNICWHFIN
jgi:hypothetical protein